MRDTGKLEQISRGVYRLADGSLPENPDLVIVWRRIPSGVICLISAPAFHDLTTQIPHEVYLALRRGAKEPRLDFPPVRSSRFGGKSFTEGIAIHRLDGTGVPSHKRH
ncbi:Transcriptional regulator, AbiEi antitoxin, Type IV TA system [Desulfacinum infernum DSM 9756]|jgi:predicted transcriptional regulator of viral defense system|uniref:Transcriptional regulator, AbiEi antitoxin, Type IV TA system n=2 Tax=Desulfacinum infernum TaxID=35837 RepID=A0A1M5E0E3_9BACT|nr:Transcriptional regulator, AbiEi antitoxin, Type IV TA system [Desulfacinum infernum DSM 9756]